MYALISRLLPSLLMIWLLFGLTACGYEDSPQNTQVNPAVQQRFNRLDYNQDGRLTPDELNRPGIFRVADRNQDGAISLQEAADYVQQRMARQQQRRNAPAPQPMTAHSPEDAPSYQPIDRVSMRSYAESRQYEPSEDTRPRFAKNRYSTNENYPTEDQDGSSPEDDSGSAYDPESGDMTVPRSSPRMRLARGQNNTAMDVADTGAVRKFLNLPYATIAGVDPNLLSLDVYAPTTGNNYPVIIMVHGGGWKKGDKANRNVIASKVRHFVGKGFIFVSVNYRLSPMVKHPAHVQDVAKALAWTHKNISRYGGNANRLYLMGHSAGAHLAALVATDQSYLQAVGKNLQIIKGVILLDGAGYDIPKLMREHNQPDFYIEAFGSNEQAWKSASPVTHIAAGKGIPPFLIFYTPRPRAQTLAERLRETLARAGVPVRVKMVNKTHAQISREVGESNDSVTQEIMDFLGKK